MKIPKPLLSRLETASSFHAQVLDTVNTVSPWISNSLLPFFPEYTDHGISHLEAVLQTSVDLASAEALQFLSPGDAALLINATLLHDSAMHLTEDGFFTLIATDGRCQGVPEFETKPWSTLWEEFLAQASRFDGRNLIELFGEATPVRRPPTDKAALTMQDRLLIGEFIRRHHARLAHEMAISGLPGPDGSAVQLLPTEVAGIERFSDIVGLVARSHGVDLRRCVDYLHRRYNSSRDYNGMHAVYVMTLLRIADYLQIQSQRAPKEVLLVRKIVSRLSQGEWRVHHCIKNITPATEDPEAIYIDAQPPDVKTYLRVKDWLNGLQKELDTSWAVLGEVYGRYTAEDLTKLTLRLRRLRSSLDDTNAFARKSSYVPERTAFSTANPDLLKLLVSPLYDGEVSFGVRELIQNSVDAVREFRDLSTHMSAINVDLHQLPDDAAVEVRVEYGPDDLPTAVVIRDRGVGMTAETVKNYFLVAGASFRKSDAWQAQHEDTRGKSRVLRSGRFGVGALAAFLLGDEIEVITRHASEPANRGVRFCGTLDSAIIQMDWTTCPVGTSIRITVPQHLKEEVHRMVAVKRQYFRATRNGDMWDFYCLRDPRVRRAVIRDGKNDEVSQNISVPDECTSWEFPWRTITHPDFSKIDWTYGGNFPDLICNGIVVSDSVRTLSFDLPPETSRPQLLSLASPKLSVFDRDGKLPLNLQRTDLATEFLPFDSELRRSITNDILAYGLVTAPEKPITAGHYDWYVGQHPAFSGFHHSAWGSTKTGVAIIDYALLRALGITRAIFLVYLREQPHSSRTLKLTAAQRRAFTDKAVVGAWHDLHLGNKQTMAYQLRQLFWGVGRSGYSSGLSTEELSGWRVFFRSNLLDEVKSNRYVSNHLSSAVNSARSKNGWRSLAAGDAPTGDFPLPPPGRTSSKTLPIAVIEAHLKPSEEEAPPPCLAEHWLQAFGPRCIPFQKSARSPLKTQSHSMLTHHFPFQPRAGRKKST